MARALERDLVILDPVGEVPDRGIQLAPRLAGLRRCTVGILENTSGRSLDLTRLPELFAEHYPDVTVVVRRKPLTSAEAPPELLAELAATCDAVIAATAQ